MKFKTIMNLGLLAGVMILASCGQTTSGEETTEVNTLVELEDMAFQEEVRAEENRLEAYIVEINKQIESSETENVEALKSEKEKAVQLLLELRADYDELTKESAAKWVLFQEGIHNFIPSAEEEINYAQELSDDNSDS